MKTQILEVNSNHNSHRVLRRAIGLGYVHGIAQIVQIQGKNRRIRSHLLYVGITPSESQNGKSGLKGYR